MRDLFVDGWNSFWHVVFGMIGAIYFPVLILFIAYQLIDPFEKNVLTDIAEGLIGYYLIKSYNSLSIT
uniref:Uncharacterized protein n=1 Tax=viral metagenome TaxID=1070528 RepID=A0A6C0ER45_9ZZZZ